LNQTSALVLRQLSQETAEGVAKVIVDALRTTRVDVLLRIGQRQTEPLDLPFIENIFEQGLVADPFVDRFYVWSDVSNEHRGEVLAFDRMQHEFIVNPPEAKLLVRKFPLVFFEPELTSFAAPEKGRPEVWRVRTGYDNQTIPQIIASRERPQYWMMAILAGVMALGVFFVARAAAREVRVAELKSNF